MEIKEGYNSKSSVKEKKENELVTGLTPYLKNNYKEHHSAWESDRTILKYKLWCFYPFIAMDNFILPSFYFLNSIIDLKTTVTVTFFIWWV